MKISLSRWKDHARQIRREVYALYLAAKDPRVPKIAKILALVVVGYALSPIDLIPDPIPILGYLDDLILIPIGVLLVVRLIPKEVLEDCRSRAKQAVEIPTVILITGIAIVLFLWIMAILLLVSLAL